MCDPGVVVVKTAKVRITARISFRLVKMTTMTVPISNLFPLFSHSFSLPYPTTLLLSLCHYHLPRPRLLSCSLAILSLTTASTPSTGQQEAKLLLVTLVLPLAWSVHRCRSTLSAPAGVLRLWQLTLIHVLGF